MRPTDTAEPPRISGTLGIVCGAGSLPFDVARAAGARNVPVFLIGITGEADKAVETYPHAWIKLGEVGRLFRLLLDHDCRDLVIVGQVSRPRLKDIQFDLGALKVMPRIVGMLAGGDDHLLSRVVAFLNEKGITVHGAHQIAPEILAGAGLLTRLGPSDDARRDARIGMQLIEALAPFDIGQAVVVENGRVLAVEAAEGTDAMITRIAGVRQGGRERTGVLVKCSKPGQDLRVDMATVGPATVSALDKANLAGLVIEARRTQIVDAAATVRAADAAGLFIEAVVANHD